MSLIENIDSQIDNRLSQIFTSIPAKVISYDKATNRGEIQIMINYKTNLNEDVPAPIVDNVPFIFPSGKNFIIDWDIEKEDHGLLFFTHAGVGNYLNSSNDEPVNSDSLDRHTLNDGIFIPSYISKPAASVENRINIDRDGNIEIKNASTGIKVSSEGEIELNGSSDGGLVKVENLNDKLNEVIDFLKSHAHNVVSLGAPTTGTLPDVITTPPPLTPPPPTATLR